MPAEATEGGIPEEEGSKAGTAKHSGEEPESESLPAAAPEMLGESRTNGDKSRDPSFNGKGSSEEGDFGDKDSTDSTGSMNSTTSTLDIAYQIVQPAENDKDISKEDLNQIHDLFDLFDDDKTGWISSAELGKLMRTLGRSFSLPASSSRPTDTVP
jgi:hypothetical protein